MIRPNIALTPLDVSLAAALAELHQICFPGGWSADACRQLLSMPAVNGCLAIGDPAALPLSPQCSSQKDGYVGFIVTQCAAFELEIVTLGVIPAVRRQHVAVAILSQTLQAAQEAKIKAVFLEVSETNLAARKLYQSQNFGIVGKRKGYYQNSDGSRTDALVCRKEL